MYSLDQKGKIEIISYEDVILSPYLDSGGVWTIGIGHTGFDGGIAVKDMPKLTIQQAFDLFSRDITRYEDAVNDLVSRDLTQDQYNALVSFQYNTGHLLNSTLLNLLNNGGSNEDCVTALKLYKYNNGKVIQGLINRRQNEANVFLNGKYSNTTSMVDLVPVSDSHKPLYSHATKIDVRLYV